MAQPQLQEAEQRGEAVAELQRGQHEVDEKSNAGQAARFQAARRVRSFLVRAHVSRIVQSPRAVLDVLTLLATLLAFSVRCAIEVAARSLRAQARSLLGRCRPARAVVAAPA